ncbi:MAG TPA: polymer-forming cytoskeletal protein [bacterium]|nr:polymer-forming cytoskeletal protein [bacterium]HPT29470.1 polymer-forming cytoskeletal protein [bacterium]
MFKKENHPENFKDVETIIGESIKVKGNFNGNGNIVIDGLLEGSLSTKGNVFIGEKAKIAGNVSAQEIIINGEISGNLNVKETLSVGSTARIYGDIECANMSIEHGAIFNGKSFMGKKVANISEKEEKIQE